VTVRLANAEVLAKSNVPTNRGRMRLKTALRSGNRVAAYVAPT